MNIKEAEKVYERLEGDEEGIKCYVSSSHVRGSGIIKDAIQRRNYDGDYIDFVIDVAGLGTHEIAHWGVQLT
jgi:hypothetical protein